MNKPLSVATFAASLFVSLFAGIACTAPEVEACEKFKEVRDACEAMNGNVDAEPVNFDLCDNVDPECKEFYECAVTMMCRESGGVHRLDYYTTCTMPEDKECTDADLRP